MPEDVVSGSDVKVEVWHREVMEIVRAFHVALAWPEPLATLRMPAARAGARESCADFRAGVWDFNPKPE